MKHQCMLFVQSLVFESSVQIVNEVFSVGDIDICNVVNAAQEILV